MNASDFASQWFESVTGEPAPDLGAPVVAWSIEAELHSGKRSQPMYEIDKHEQAIRCYLHAGQLAAWESGARFVVANGGKQSGKTSFAPLWALREIIDAGYAGDGLAVSATSDLTILKLLPAMLGLLIDELGIGRWWGGDRIIELCNPQTGAFGARHSKDHASMHGRVIFRTAESEAQMQSATANWAVTDELGLYKRKVWDDLQGRLALNEGRVLAPTTGYFKRIWFKELVQSPPDGVDVVTFESRANPAFSDAEWSRLRDSMPAHEFNLNYRGVWSSPPGLIYDDFVDEYREHGGHLVRRFDVPKQWARHVGVDPGVIHPAKVWLAHDANEDVYYVYREAFGADNSTSGAGVQDDDRMTSKEHAAADVALARARGERVVTWAIGAKSEKYWRRDYKSAGAKGVKAPDTAEVWEGIDRVMYLLREHRLYIMDDCHGLLGDIRQYARELDDNNDPTDKIKDKDAFHYADALRYIAQQVVKRNKLTVGVEVGRYA